jgi:hypothetical protein
VPARPVVIPQRFFVGIHLQINDSSVSSGPISLIGANHAMALRLV